MGKVTYSALGRNGRLANSLFQAVATLAYGMEHGKEILFPEWKYNKYMVKPLPTGPINVDRIYNEPTFHYSKIPFFPGDVDLGTSYFQSAKYFEKYWHEIRPYVTLKPEYVDYMIKKYGELFLRRSCSIHVRHGDYLTNATHRDYHGVLPIEYYQEAVRILYGQYFNNVQYLIFSDDLDWCRENFNLNNQIFVEDEEDIIDLFLGSCCNDHIVANSSFSWWQAFLGRHPEKKVVAPRRWFMPKANLNTKDLYCEGWKII